MNKKQFMITVLLLGLMAFITFGQNLFKDKMVNINVDEGEYKNYSALDEKYIYALPKEWESEGKKFPGNLVIYHDDFKSTKEGITGNIELINSKEDLNNVVERFTKIIKEEKLNTNIINKDFETEKYNGKKIVYEFTASTGQKYSIREYIFKLSDKILVKYKFSNKVGNDNNDIEKRFNAIIDKFKQ